MDMARAIEVLVDHIAALSRELEEVTRRQRNMFRPAEVTEAAPDSYRVKVDASGLLSDEIPFMAPATGGQDGQNMMWAPPAKGTRGYLVSPSGEPGVGFFMPVHWDNQDNKPPSTEDEFMLGRKGKATGTYQDEMVRHQLEDSKKARVVMRPDYVKLRFGDDFLIVKDGQLIVSKMPIVGEDPEPDR